MHSRGINWPTCAAQLARAIPVARWDAAVLAWMQAQTRSRVPWYIAVSGGADSIALLLLLWAHWPERRRSLRVLHFDHRLRGAASTGDATFCRKVCRALRVKFILGEWRRDRPRERPSEAEARNVRHAFFDSHARILWLGHHLDDVAETMLMRLARGSGAGGLSAPRPVQHLGAKRVRLRPLLGLKKSEIITALKSVGASWREDATNGTPDFFRNRVRRDVIPAWVAAAQRDAIAGAGRARELLAEDDAALDAWVGAIAPFSKTGDLLISRLRGKPRAVWRRALQRYLLSSPARIDVSRQAFEALLSAAEAGKPTQHSLGREVFGVLRAGRLRLKIGKPAGNFQRRVN